jgi:hypothetical protein
VEVSNPSSSPVQTLAVIPVFEAAQTALGFPGTLAIAVMPGAAVRILPSQADDVDGDGWPDEFVFPVRLEARETRTVHVYYSTTLHDSIPWPKRVHASHTFGYNRATAALESEQIGYRTYGGFFLDIQARKEGKPGLHNALVGYFGSSNPAEIGQDIIHLGDTLGLGGIFLREGNNVYRPPLNMPDYAHKASPPDVPQYRVVADGPLRALVEARMEHWKIGSDEVELRALYSIAASAEHVECRFRILPVRVGGTYEVGAGIRHLPRIQLNNAAGRLALSGIQTDKIGELSLALYFDPAEAETRESLVTKDDSNECIVFRQRLDRGHAAEGRYWLAGAWSGSGIKDLLAHMTAIGNQARASVRVGKYVFSRTPNPRRVEGEAN